MSSVECPSTKISSVAGPHHRRARDGGGDVAGLVARRHDHADARPLRRLNSVPRAQHVDPVERRVLHRRRPDQVAVQRGRQGRHLERQQQSVLVPHHLDAGDVEQVAEVRVRQPVRRRRGLLPAAHLGQPHRHLPEVVERGQIDATAGRQAPLQPRQQGTHVEDAVAEPVADDGVEERGAGGTQPLGSLVEAPSRRRRRRRCRGGGRGRAPPARAGSRCRRGAGWGAPPAAPPRRCRPPAPRRRPGSGAVSAAVTSSWRKSRAAGCRGASLARR